MTSDAGRPTVPDYLWDPAAAPDPDVGAIERSLESLRFEHRRRPLVIPHRPRARWRPVALAVAASLVLPLLSGAAFLTWRESWPSGRAWPVTVRPAPAATSGPSVLAVDRTLQLDASASAVVDIARIGAMEVGPGSAVTLSETTSTRHRVVLDRGEVSVRVWAPPGRFAIHTPAGDVLDLGCIFRVSVDAAGATVLHVDTGWVQLANAIGESLVPAGASATMAPGVRPSVPVYDDAAPGLLLAVRAFEGTSDDASLARLTDEIARLARPRDAITLLVLASTATDLPRRALLERASHLTPPPPGVTVDRIVADPRQLWVWYDALDLPPVKSWWRNWRDAFPHPLR